MNSNAGEICIAGVGLHPFGRHPNVPAQVLAASAVRNALRDAGMVWQDIQIAFGASLDAHPDGAVSMLGQTGITFINVRNGCASAGSALFAAKMAIESGQCDIAIAVGADNHERGAFRTDPKAWGGAAWAAEMGFAVAPQFFAMKTQRYFHDWEIPESTAIKVAERAFRNGSLTPHAWRREPLDYQTIANSPMLCHPLRKYMLTNPCAGGGAAILCRPEVAKRYTQRAIGLASVVVNTRVEDTFEVGALSVSLDVQPSPSVYAAKAAYESSGMGPDDMDVIQLQDTDSGTEIIHYAECGFCDDGEQTALIDNGETEIGGTMPVNTDGGLLANGEPVGASGLRQIYEVVQQLRGEAGDRQVPGDPNAGFTHVYGGPGVSAVTVLKR